MISQKIQDALNDHLNHEIFSGYLYLSMAASFDQINLPGFANWMKVQAQEEFAHAGKIYDYIHERGGRVVFDAIDKPQNTWDSPLATFAHAYEHEQGVSKRINNLVDLAESERDRASKIFLEWFVAEQVEEEASVDAVVQQLKLIQGAPQGLFLVDRELGQRSVAPPA